MANDSFLQKMLAAQETEKLNFVSDNVKETNKLLAESSAFNENAALQLDAIYNFLAMNKNLFKGNVADVQQAQSSLPKLDEFFDRNGYIPVKIINPRESNGGGSLPAGGRPRGRPRPPRPPTVPVTAPAPVMNPMSAFARNAGTFIGSLGLMEQFKKLKDFKLPEATPAPDLVTPKAPETSSFSMGDPMGFGGEAFGLDPQTPTDLSQASPAVRAINEHPYAFLSVLGLTPLLGVIGAPTLTWGSIFGGSLAAATSAATASEVPIDQQKMQIPNLHGMSYNTDDASSTIEFKADELKFDSDVIKFMYRGFGISSDQGTYATQSGMPIPVNYSLETTQSSTPAQSDYTIPQSSSGNVKLIEAYGPNRPGRPNQGVIDLITSAAENAGIGSLKLTSGKGDYISPEGRRRGQTTSQHSTGNAVDISGSSFANEAQKLEFIKMLKAMGAGGVGVYDNGSVHVDLGPDRQWNWGFANNEGFMRAINEGKKMQGSFAQPSTPSTGKDLNGKSTDTFVNRNIPQAPSSPPVQAQPEQREINYSPSSMPGSDKPMPAMTVFEENLFKKSAMFA